MLDRSTLQLLRVPFSVFLAPIYFFALSEVDSPNWVNAILVFFILHLLVYPASNGYNSYMDRDTGPIGGLERPPAPLRQLYHLTIVLDLLAILLGFIIHPVFGLLMPIYIGASKIYSYRRIRIKQYPIAGFLLVVLVQGAFTFWLVWFGASSIKSPSIPWLPMLACLGLIGGFYPLTQIYQHEQDRADNVTTISYLLGYRGTFIFCGLLYVLSIIVLGLHYFQINQLINLWIFLILLVPVIIQFLSWMRKVWNNNAHANFKNTMRMTWTAAVFTNIAFIILVIRNFYFE